MNYKTYKPILKSYAKLDNKFNKMIIQTPQKTIFLSKKQYDILNYCTGEHTVCSIGYQLSQDYQACIDVNKVNDFVQYATNEKWIEIL